jgi:glutathione S-transferase
MAELHKPPYEKINVNGRVPAIEEPNTGITLWESGAITEYLQETYDKNNTSNYTCTPEKYLVKQWLHFQISRFLYYFVAEILSHGFQSLFHKCGLLFLDKSQY